MPLIEMLNRGFDPAAFLTWVLALAVGITVHEFAHAWRADRAGDPTPRAHGRVSLNPLDHYDPMGSTLLLLFGFGWGKPVPVNPFMFRNPRRDQLMVSLWGPLSNLIVATALSLVVRLGVAGVYGHVLVQIVVLQLILAVFNLIPVYPLDGSHILSAMLPVAQARKLDAVYHQYGALLLVAVVVVAGRIVWPVVETLASILLGA
jgi:Zn-dependent protease